MANWSFNRKRGFRKRIDKSVRSNFEAHIKQNLIKAGVAFEYEAVLPLYNHTQVHTRLYIV